MKKFFKTIVSGLALLVLLVGFVPKTSVFAAEEKVFNIVPSNFNDAPTQTQDKYNISEVSNLKPFEKDADGNFIVLDASNGDLKTLPGMSFRLETDESGQIQNKSIIPQSTEPLGETSGKSLFAWIHFDSYSLHNISIHLDFESGGYVEWNLSAFQLLGIINNPETGRQPHGWRLLEFPFASVSAISGQIQNQRMTSLCINYTSEMVSDVQVYARLTFYNIYVASQKSETNAISLLDGQGFLVNSFSDVDPVLRESYVVGDTFVVPAFGSAINYFYLGDLNLKRGQDFNAKGPGLYAWVAYVFDPVTEEKTRVFSGDGITFENEGTYRLEYHCTDTSGDDLFTHIQSIKVRQLNPIYCDKATLRAVVGQKYVINVFASDLITKTADFEVLTTAEGLEVTYLQNGQIEIVAHQAGTFEFEIGVKGSRLAKPSEETYSAKFSVVAVAPKKDNRLVLKIVLWSLLGVFGVVLVVFVIKTLVRARKFDVK